MSLGVLNSQTDIQTSTVIPELDLKASWNYLLYGNSLFCTSLDLWTLKNLGLCNIRILPTDNKLRNPRNFGLELAWNIMSWKFPARHVGWMVDFMEHPHERMDDHWCTPVT